MPAKMHSLVLLLIALAYALTFKDHVLRVLAGVRRHLDRLRSHPRWYRCADRALGILVGLVFAAPVLDHAYRSWEALLHGTPA